MIVQADTVDTIDDIVVRYVNHLLMEEAKAQAMLQDPPKTDEALRYKLNQALGTIEALRLQIENLRNKEADLLSSWQQDRAAKMHRKYTDDPDYRKVVERVAPFADHSKVIDGEAAIKTGRINLKEFVEKASAPERGID